ncbi:MAG: zinc ribbon domain-containing protein [Myxococcota bacterium]
MPIYEYHCSDCGETCEALQKIHAAAPKKCPTCGKQGTLAKSISRSAFHLKGGGWYRDLYASPKPKQTAGSNDKGKQNKQKKKAATKEKKN